MSIKQSILFGEKISEKGQEKKNKKNTRAMEGENSLKKMRKERKIGNVKERNKRFSKWKINRNKQTITIKTKPKTYPKKNNFDGC